MMRGRSQSPYESVEYTHREISPPRPEQNLTPPYKWEVKIEDLVLLDSGERILCYRRIYPDPKDDKVNQLASRENSPALSDVDMADAIPSTPTPAGRMTGSKKRKPDQLDSTSNDNANAASVSTTHGADVLTDFTSDGDMMEAISAPTSAKKNTGAATSAKNLSDGNELAFRNAGTQTSPIDHDRATKKEDPVSVHRLDTIDVLHGDINNNDANAVDPIIVNTQKTAVPPIKLKLPKLHPILAGNNEKTKKRHKEKGKVTIRLPKEHEIWTLDEKTSQVITTISEEPYNSDDERDFADHDKDEPPLMPGEMRDAFSSAGQMQVPGWKETAFAGSDGTKRHQIYNMFGLKEVWEGDPEWKATLEEEKKDAAAKEETGAEKLDHPEMVESIGDVKMSATVPQNAEPQQMSRAEKLFHYASNHLEDVPDDTNKPRTYEHRGRTRRARGGGQMGDRSTQRNFVRFWKDKMAREAAEGETGGDLMLTDGE